MLEATHIKIAQEIAKELRLNDRESALLQTGSRTPDSWKDFPHHEGKEAKIIKLIFESRYIFSKGNNSCYSLGFALHYLADRWTLRPGMKDKHTDWEHSIASAQLFDDEHLRAYIKDLAVPQSAKNAYLDHSSTTKCKKRLP